MRCATLPAQRTAGLVSIKGPRLPAGTKRPFRNLLSGVQLVEQSLGLLQVERVKAFGEPAVDWSDKIAGLIPFALIAFEPRHAHRGAQFPGLCLLRARDGERALKIRFRFRRVRLWRFKRDFAGYALDFGLKPPFLGCFRRRHRFAEAAPGVIEFSEVRIGQSQK